MTRCEYLKLKCVNLRKASLKGPHLHSSPCGFWEEQMVYVERFLFDSWKKIFFVGVKEMSTLCSEKNSYRKTEQQESLCKLSFDSLQPKLNSTLFPIFLHGDTKNVSTKRVSTPACRLSSSYERRLLNPGKPYKLRSSHEAGDAKQRKTPTKKTLTNNSQSVFTLTYINFNR